MEFDLLQNLTGVNTPPAFPIAIENVVVPAGAQYQIVLIPGSDQEQHEFESELFGLPSFVTFDQVNWHIIVEATNDDIGDHLLTAKLTEKSTLEKHSTSVSFNLTVVDPEDFFNQFDEPSFEIE